MTTPFFEGLSGPWAAARLLAHNATLRRWALGPLAANGVVYGLVVTLGLYLLGIWQPRVGPWEFAWGLGAWLAWSLNLVLGPLKWIVGLPLLIWVCYCTFTTVGMVVASPFNDLLSERTERWLCRPPTQHEPPAGSALGAMGVSLIDSLVLVLKQAAMMVLALPFLLVPAIGFLPLLLVAAHYTGLGMVDVAMARNRLRPVHKKALLQDRRWAVFGLGLALELLFFVPLVGLAILPLGVVAGTMLYIDYDWQGGLAKRNLPPPEGFIPPRPFSRAV